VLAEIGMAQAVASLVAGVVVYFVTSATGWQLDLVLALWCWGALSALALFWSWRRGVRARSERLAMLDAARSRGLIGG
jgi:hypothetical protein